MTSTPSPRCSTPPSAADPTAENPGYANKLVLTHGASCDTAYELGSAPDVMLQDALSQGFAVASHALDNAGHNCNIVTQAESLIVTKEMVAERFGPIRYTIGSGCSGGSLVQQQVANAYPGVYQGITPQCSFTDAWSSAQQYVDFVGLRNYLEGPGLADGILPAQWAVDLRPRQPGQRDRLHRGDPEQRRPAAAPAPACRPRTSTAPTTPTASAARSRTTWSTSSGPSTAARMPARPAGRSATSASSTACPGCWPTSTATPATRPVRR